MHTQKADNRQLHIDLLRIFACFSVLMLHSASQFWYSLPVESGRWMVCNIYDAAFRFGVPIFVMISGRFFLARPGDVDIKKLYDRHVLRIFAAYVIWSAVYGLWDCRLWFAAEGVTLKDYAAEMLFGRYHLWYLPMLLGIYVLLPVLKSWTDHCSRQNLEYFLGLFVILQIGISSMQMCKLPAVAWQVLNQFDVTLVCSYVGYFVLGYYLYRYPVSVKTRHILYLLGAVGLFGAVGGSIWDSQRQGVPSAAAFDSFSIFTFLVTVAIYVFFADGLAQCSFTRSAGLVREVSADTFGIYLMHILLLEILESAGVTTMSIDNILGIPLMAAGCFVLCGIVAAVLRRIPFIGKYIC